MFIYLCYLVYILLPASQFIAAPKAIEVDFVKALNRWPGLWGVAPTAWAERLAVLRELNFEVAKLVAAYPSVLSLPPNQRFD